MTVYVKPAVRHAWAELASGSDIQDPGDSYAAAGYLLGVKPPRQFDNWLYNFAFNGLRYFCQVGIVDYDAAETYPLGGIVRGPDGIVYRSLAANNVGHTPASSPTQWGAPQFFTPGPTDNSNSVATTAWVRGYALPLGTSIGSLSGTVTNGQIPVGAVTQWQGSLAIGFSQLVGTLFNSQVTLGNVTQWQGSLSIAWGQITGTKNADQLEGLVVGPDGGFGANSIPRYDGSGYLYAAYLNQASANNENPSIGQVIVTNGSDNFFRKESLAAFRLAMAPSASHGPTGWTTTPDGIMLQWGQIAVGDIGSPVNGTLTFTKAFTQLYRVMLTGTDANNTFPTYELGLISQSNGGFVWCARESVSATQNLVINYFAVGQL